MAACVSVCVCNSSELRKELALVFIADWVKWYPEM